MFCSSGKTHLAASPRPMNPILVLKRLGDASWQQNVRTLTGCDQDPRSCVRRSTRCRKRPNLDDEEYEWNVEDPGQLTATDPDWKPADEAEVDGSVNNLPGGKPLTCDVCQYRTSVSTNLKRHMRTHTGEKPYACNECEYKCAHPTSLDDHMTIHTGVKPYTCDNCGYRTGRASHYHRHMRTHTGEKPYSCDECEYRAAHTDDIKKHMWIHEAGEKPYGCEDCEYRTGSSTDLRKHLRIHTGEKPYSCAVCGYKAVRSNHVKSHMKTHNPTGRRRKTRTRNDHRRESETRRLQVKAEDTSDALEDDPLSMDVLDIKMEPFEPKHCDEPLIKTDPELHIPDSGPSGSIKIDPDESPAACFSLNDPVIRGSNQLSTDITLSGAIKVESDEQFAADIRLNDRHRSHPKCLSCDAALTIKIEPVELSAADV